MEKWWVLALVSLTIGCVSNEKMIEAAGAGETGTVLEAVEDGADLTFRSRAPGRHGDTAMAAAARNGHVNTVEALVRQGVKPRDQPEAIIAAAGGGHDKVVQLLLDNGASPNALLPTDVPGGEVRSALGMASLGGHSGTVELLLRARAEARANTSVALRNAIRGGHPDIAEVLIARGASAKETGPDQTTVIHLAAALREGERRGTNRGDLIRKLAKAGAPIDSANAQGDTPLMLAVRSEAFRHVEVLLELGAKPNRDIPGSGTPAQWADKHKDQSPEMSKIARILAAK